MTRRRDADLYPRKWLQAEQGGEARARAFGSRCSGRAGPCMLRMHVPSPGVQDFGPRHLSRVRTPEVPGSSQRNALSLCYTLGARSAPALAASSWPSAHNGPAPGSSARRSLGALKPHAAEAQFDVAFRHAGLFQPRSQAAEPRTRPPRLRQDPEQHGRRGVFRKRSYEKAVAFRSRSRNVLHCGLENARVQAGIALLSTGRRLGVHRTWA